MESSVGTSFFGSVEPTSESSVAPNVLNLLNPGPLTDSRFVLECPEEEVWIPSDQTIHWGKRPNYIYPTLRLQKKEEIPVPRGNRLVAKLWFCEWQWDEDKGASPEEANAKKAFAADPSTCSCFEDEKTMVPFEKGCAVFRHLRISKQIKLKKTETFTITSLGFELGYHNPSFTKHPFKSLDIFLSKPVRIHIVAHKGSVKLMQKHGILPHNINQVSAIPRAVSPTPLGPPSSSGSLAPVASAPSTVPARTSSTTVLPPAPAAMPVIFTPSTPAAPAPSMQPVAPQTTLNNNNNNNSLRVMDNQLSTLNNPFAAMFSSLLNGGMGMSANANIINSNNNANNNSNTNSNSTSNPLNMALALGMSPQSSLSFVEMINGGTTANSSSNNTDIMNDEFGTTDDTQGSVYDANAASLLSPSDLFAPSPPPTPTNTPILNANNKRPHPSSALSTSSSSSSSVMFSFSTPGAHAQTQSQTSKDTHSILESAKKLKQTQLNEIVEELSLMQQQMDNLKRRIYQFMSAPPSPSLGPSRKLIRVSFGPLANDGLAPPPIKSFIFYAFRTQNLNLGVSLIRHYNFDILRGRNSNGYSLLHVCARHAFAEGIVWCLQQGLAVNATTNLQYTPLHFAYLRNDKQVRQLLKRGQANTEALNCFGLKPKDYHNSRKPLVRPLPESACCVEVLLEGYEHPFFIAIWFAARLGWLEVLKMYIEELGCDVDVKNTNGQTPLMCACEYRHEDAARYLLQMGADPNARDIHDSTPLHYAYMESVVENEAILKMLESAGADPSLKNIFGRPPQWYHDKHMDLDAHNWGSVKHFLM